MSVDVEAQRGLLVRLRSMVEQYERCSQKGMRLMRGVRYQMAVDATDVNGDECLFPACGCAKADCAQAPSSRPSIDWTGMRR